MSLSEPIKQTRVVDAAVAPLDTPFNSSLSRAHDFQEKNISLCIFIAIIFIICVSSSEAGRTNASKETRSFPERNDVEMGEDSRMFL